MRMESFGPRRSREIIPPKTKSVDEIIIYASADIYNRSNLEKSSIKSITEKYDTLGRNKPDSDQVLTITEEEDNEKYESVSANSETCSDPNYEAVAPLETKKTGVDKEFTREPLYEQIPEPVSLKPPAKLDDYELTQIEVFYSSNKTQVFVCGCECKLYDCDFKQPEVAAEDAVPVCTGVPVLVLNTGESFARRERHLQLIVAERGTGFRLWKDKVDNLSGYKLVRPDYHTMFCSTNHRKLYGLKFSDVSAADKFHSTVQMLTSNPSDPALKLVNAKKQKRSRKTQSFVLPRKEEISSPCCFQHVTSLELSDMERFESLRDILRVVESAGGEMAANDKYSAIFANV